MATKKTTRRLLSKNDITLSVARNRARVEALFASIGEGAVATDDRGRIIRINQVALNMLGFKRAEMLHKRLPDAIVAVNEDGSLVNVADRSIAKVYISGQSERERSIYKRKDGSFMPVQVTTSPIMFKGLPIGAIVVFRDLSPEIEADKMKSDFISVASHQLRTPLSAINIYTQMLEDQFAGSISKQQRSYIQTILGSVERMNELINTLLNITRIEAGGIKVKTSSVNIAKLAQEMLAEIVPALKDKNISLTSGIDDVQPIMTDNLLVKEVVANLLSNAIKYTPEGGSIKVSLGSSNNDVTFSVKDSGVGIPVAAQKRIFTKFFRAENAMQEDANGTGLGLYLTKIITGHLGGEVWFDSAPGEGSTFYLSLPKRSLISDPGHIKLGF